MNRRNIELINAIDEMQEAWEEVHELTAKMSILYEAGAYSKARKLDSDLHTAYERLEKAKARLGRILDMSTDDILAAKVAYAITEVTRRNAVALVEARRQNMALARETAGCWD